MSDLIVTRGDGVPVSNQAMGVELFRAQARNSYLEQRILALEAALRFWMPGREPIDPLPPDQLARVRKAWHEHRALLHDSQDARDNSAAPPSGVGRERQDC